MALLNPLVGIEGGRRTPLEALGAARRAGWAIHKGSGQHHQGATDFVDRSRFRLVEANSQVAPSEEPKSPSFWRGAVVWRVAAACLATLAAMGKHHGFDH